MERLLKSRYRTQDQISDNPFSVTYKGVFVGTDKPVIIKIYKRGTLSSTIINQMKQKVKDFSLISHHGIAKLIDGDYGWQGFYYVREYIEGETLQQIIESGRQVTVDQALSIGEEVCRALEFAHSRGIVHGALKPSNILIDKEGVVKLTDFVVEGEIKEALPQKVLSIMDNGAYASPEELAGQPAGRASDLYALGLILYELVVGRIKSAAGGLAGGLLKLQSPRLFTPEQLAALPRYLQEIIARALQLDPLLRFSSAVEFAESLASRKVISREPALAEYLTLFDNTVTQYGGEAEAKAKASELVEDLGRLKIRWGREKDRRWLLVLILGVAIASGLLYAFLLGR